MSHRAIDYRLLRPIPPRLVKVDEETEKDPDVPLTKTLERKVGRDVYAVRTHPSDGNGRASLPALAGTPTSNIGRTKAVLYRGGAAGGSLQPAVYAGTSRVSKRGD